MPYVEQQYYDLYISGTKLQENYLSLVEEIIYEDNATGSDMLHITISDPDFIFISDKFFIEDAPVHLTAGFVENAAVNFDGYISVIDVDFPKDGKPSLVLHCMDNSHLMNRVPKKRTWKKTTVSAVASLIFAEYGLTPAVDSTGTVEDTISQSNETDIDFLTNKAKDQTDDFICYVEGNKGYFIKRDVLATPQTTLDYRSGNGNLMSFRPRINKESKQVAINKDNVNSSTGKVSSDSASNSDQRPLQGSATDSGGMKYLGGGVWEKV